MGAVEATCCVRKTVAEIVPKLVYKMNGSTQDVYDVPAEITKAVDDFVVPKRYRRKGAGDASFMYSSAFCPSLDPALGI